MNGVHVHRADLRDGAEKKIFFFFLVENGKSGPLDLSKLLSIVVISFQLYNIHLGANILSLFFFFLVYFSQAF